MRKIRKCLFYAPYVVMGAVRPSKFRQFLRCNLLAENAIDASPDGTLPVNFRPEKKRNFNLMQTEIVLSY
jgi:hypothetical protein